MLDSTVDHNRLRLITVVAAAVIALACGTNYVYSAWAPQFAQRLKLSSTQSNLIGTFGNLGMYASGVPLGVMIDAKTPRWGVALGIVLFGAGYYPIAQAYNAGPGVYGMPALCLFSFFTGAGSCSAFNAALKAAALNYPESRGTATAFPLAAFGLSAFFFAVISTALPHGTYTFLLLLASGTVLLPIVSFPFLNIFPNHSYQTLPTTEARPLQQRKSSEDDRPYPDTNITPPSPTSSDPEVDGSEHSSLLDAPPSTSRHSSHSTTPDSPHHDIRGLALLPLLEFWQLFSMLGLLTGIGLMTINNIGNDAQALWKHYQPSVDPSYIESRQSLHVSILSFCSFTGRLLSGVGSDILVARFNRSRFWCLFASAVIFCAAQLVATRLENPHLLILVSGLTGLAYGILFGVYPSLVAHAFGVHGMSQNWGTMTLAPVIAGNIFNLIYGRIFDSHSVVDPNGARECDQGKVCYAAAYWVTFFAAIGAVGMVLWSIWHENQVYKRREKAHTIEHADDGDGREHSA